MPYRSSKLTKKDSSRKDRASKDYDLNAGAATVKAASKNSFGRFLAKKAT